VSTALTPEALTLNAQRLARLTERLLAPEPSAATIDRFYRCLDAVLQEPLDVQREVLAQTWQALAGKADAVQRLREEIELECELQYIQTDRHRERVAVLFALPLVCEASELPAQLELQDRESLQDLASGLTESDVVHFSAQVSLYPKLWTLEQLEALAPGDVRLLTRCMGVQAARGCVVYEPLPAVAAGPGVSTEAQQAKPADTKTPAQHRRRKSRKPVVAGENMRLYFVLGVVCAGAEQLEDLFPQLPDQPSSEALEPDERASAEKGLLLGAVLPDSPARPNPDDDLAWNHTPGQFEDGTVWEDFFYEQVAYAFGIGAPVLGTLTPNGYFEDVLIAQQLARKVGLLRLLEPYLDSLNESSDTTGNDGVDGASDTAPDGLQVAGLEFRPYASRGGSQGVELTLELADNSARPWEPLRLRWPVLPGEDAPSALAELQEMMLDLGLPNGTEFDLGDAAQARSEGEPLRRIPALPVMPASLLLH